MVSRGAASLYCDPGHIEAVQDRVEVIESLAGDSKEAGLKEADSRAADSMAAESLMDEEN